jgi:hypothetical protein
LECTSRWNAGSKAAQSLQYLRTNGRICASWLWTNRDAVPEAHSGEAVIKIAAAFLALCAAGICAAQPAVTATPSAPTKHYRLTFVLTYPQDQQPPQTFVLDIPVTRERPGTSEMSVNSGLTGQLEESVAEKIQCTDVQESATGLAAQVNFAMDSVTKAPPPYSNEPLHHNLSFDRKVDLVLGKPTQITNEMRPKPLRQGDEAVPGRLPAAPQITVTAVQTQ